MWFGCVKSKEPCGLANRRRRHVLDVKLRSDQVRAARMRLGALAFGVLFGTVFGLVPALAHRRVGAGPARL